MGAPSIIEPYTRLGLRLSRLWGYHARDPVSGENAPGGARYNRDGTIRRAWHDPLGWAGMDKVLPPPETIKAIQEQTAQLQDNHDLLEEKITSAESELLSLNLEINAMRENTHLKRNFKRHTEELEERAEMLADMREELATCDPRLDALRKYEKKLLSGGKDPLRAHIRNPMLPETTTHARMNRLAETWAAFSIGGMMIAFVMVALFARHYLFSTILIMIGGTILIEAMFRRRLSILINRLTILMAFAASLVLVFEFFWLIIIILIVIAGAYIIIENLRELWLH